MSEWSHETQQEWEQLCDYLKLCVESSGTISADYHSDEGTPSWRVWDSEHPSRLLSQNRDASIEVPLDSLQEMQKPTGASRLLYGYPSVAFRENSKIKIAPVCYVEMEIRQAHNNQDKGSALLIPTTRTVFNHGLLLAPWSAVDQEEAAELLREIEQRSDEGDYQAYLGAVVSALGRGSSELNPRSLQSYVSRDARFAQNTAIFLYAQADYTATLLKELEELRYQKGLGRHSSGSSDFWHATSTPCEPEGALLCCSSALKCRSGKGTPKATDTRTNSRHRASRHRQDTTRGERCR